MNVLFAHGAGAGTAHPWMTAWTERLAALGPVTAFDYPYMAAGKRRPDRLPKLLDAHRQALADVRAAHGDRVLLAGKSMGGRVGCHLAVDDPSVAGVVCFGYPLAGGGNRDKLRDQVLLDLRVPVLFLQGTRDKLCPLDLLDEVRQRMSAPSTLHVVDTGDHGLQVTKTWCKQTGKTQDDVDADMLAVVQRFVEGL